MKKILVPVLASALMMSASVAQAVQITYTSATPADGSGKTSQQTKNVFVETFDRADGSGGLTMDQSLVKVTQTGGGLGFAKGDRDGAYAAPANNTTNFAYGPAVDSGETGAQVKFDFAGLLGSLPMGGSLNYFGMYYGSIDTYNDVIFYNAAGEIIQTITGAFLIDQFNGQSGNQDADSSNIYVNLFFTPTEQFTAFSLVTTDKAFELDNLVVGYNIVSPVPEPASMALLGLGLAGLGYARRRNKK